MITHFPCLNSPKTFLKIILFYSTQTCNFLRQCNLNNDLEMKITLAKWAIYTRPAPPSWRAIANVRNYYYCFVLGMSALEL